jgi:hypothetical protein
MAKVKSALEKIKAALVAKGMSLDEVKDSIAELEAADIDLESAADALNKNKQWLQWYNDAAPEIQNAMSERDQLKGQLQKLEAAGIRLTAEQKEIVNNPAPGSKGEYVSPADLEKFKAELAGASSNVMKQMVDLSFKHYKKFGDKPDWDAVEKLIVEKKAGSIDDAYRQYSKPMREKAREEKLQKRIDEGIKQGVQDQISKLGISMPKKRGDAVEQELLAKATVAKSYKDLSPEEQRQYDNSLRDGFVSDINSEVTH